MKKNIIAILVSTCLLMQGCATTAEQGYDAYWKKNYTVALVKLLPSARNGDASAQSSVGWMCLTGNGTTQNYKNAFDWFVLAANQGEPAAINNIGSMYENGQGMPADIEKAVSWYTLAARHNLPIAQANLTRLGRPIPALALVPQQAPQQATDKSSDGALLLLMGVMNGAAAYQQGKAAGYQSAPTPLPAYQPPINCTSTGLGNTVRTHCQ